MMAIDQVNGSSANGVHEGSPSQHPFTPLTSSEIASAAELVKKLYPDNVDLHFKTITLEEPKKADVIPFLVAEHEGRNPDPLPRKAFVTYYIRNTVSRAREHMQ